MLGKKGSSVRDIAVTINRRGFAPRHKTNTQKEHIMRIRDIIADLIGIICIFGIGYGLLLIGYGLGL